MASGAARKFDVIGLLGLCSRVTDLPLDLAELQNIRGVSWKGGQIAGYLLIPVVFYQHKQ